MRVQVTSKEKKFLTVAEMPAVRHIILDMKEDGISIEYYADMAMRAFKGSGFEIFRPKATIARNCRVNDRFFEGSGKLDVWIEFLAFNPFYGAYDCGVYVSDLWDLCDENAHELAEKMYINAFTKEKS